MDIDDFKICIVYILNNYYKTIQNTPDTDTINAVRNYNLMRAQNAKNIATLIDSNDFLEKIRHSSGVKQLNCSPPNTTCVISGETLSTTMGKTLILSLNNDNIPFCIHQRYLKNINNYFCIMHFDKEIVKQYTDFMVNVNKIPNKNNIQSFITYNNLSNIKRLMIKFNNICEN
jgi:hypothetical protein